MSKFNRKRLKTQLNPNYKLFGWLGSWIEEIENRINNINGDGVIDTIENIIKNIWSKIYNLENKHDNEMSVESQVRKDNDDFLQNQINTIKDTSIPDLQNQINTIKDTSIPDLQNQIDVINNTTIPAINETITNNFNTTDERITKEIQDRIAGDNAINKRIDDIQFLKWLVRLEYGASLEQKMLLQSENWVKYFELPDNYFYTRCYIISEYLLINTQLLYCGELQLLDYGVRLNLVIHDSKSCLEVTYTATENKHGELSSTDTVVINVLLTQFYYGDVE